MHRHVEGGEVDGVAVNLADVEVCLYFGDGDVVCGAPDFGRSGGVLGL